MAGGPHHTVLTTAMTPRCCTVRDLTRSELVLIDAPTTRRQSGNELRWNAAYQLLHDR